MFNRLLFTSAVPLRTLTTEKNKRTKKNRRKGNRLVRGPLMKLPSPLPTLVPKVAIYRGQILSFIYPFTPQNHILVKVSFEI